jgi:hypothetical protein
LFDLVITELAVLEGKHDIVEHRRFVQQIEMLKDHSDVASLFLQFCVADLLLVISKQHFAFNRDLACSWLLQQVDRANQR